MFRALFGTQGPHQLSILAAAAAAIAKGAEATSLVQLKRHSPAVARLAAADDSVGAALRYLPFDGLPPAVGKTLFTVPSEKLRAEAAKWAPRAAAGSAVGPQPAENDRSALEYDVAARMIQAAWQRHCGRKRAVELCDGLRRRLRISLSAKNSRTGVRFRAWAQSVRERLAKEAAAWAAREAEEQAASARAAVRRGNYTERHTELKALRQSQQALPASQQSEFNCVLCPLPAAPAVSAAPPAQSPSIGASAATPLLAIGRVFGVAAATAMALRPAATTTELRPPTALSADARDFVLHPHKSSHLAAEAAFAAYDAWHVEHCCPALKGADDLLERDDGGAEAGATDPRYEELREWCAKAAHRVGETREALLLALGAVDDSRSWGELGAAKEALAALQATIEELRKARKAWQAEAPAAAARLRQAAEAAEAAADETTPGAAAGAVPKSPRTPQTSGSGQPQRGGGGAADDTDEEDELRDAGSDDEREFVKAGGARKAGGRGGGAKATGGGSGRRKRQGAARRRR